MLASNRNSLPILGDVSAKLKMVEVVPSFIFFCECVCVCVFCTLERTTSSSTPRLPLVSFDLHFFLSAKSGASFQNKKKKKKKKKEAGPPPSHACMHSYIIHLRDPLSLPCFGTPFARFLFSRLCWLLPCHACCIQSLYAPTARYNWFFLFISQAVIRQPLTLHKNPSLL